MSAAECCDRGDPRQAIAAGVAHVPEDRLGTGLAPSISISRNTVLKTYRSPPVSRGPFLALRRIGEHARSLMERYDVKAPGPDTPARNLSGGNLQKLVLGREFEGDPKVLIAAQPTRGLDVGAIETVHAYLRRAAAGGVAVLLVSEDLDEALALADRLVVMYEGRIVGEADAAQGDRRGDRLPDGRRAGRGMRLERRLEQPWWLSVAVPLGSLAVAFGIMAVVLAATGHDPGSTFHDIVDAGFTGNGALTYTLVSATPILFTGLAAAAAFRMQLFNIGAEGQLYLGAIGAAWIALKLGDHGVVSTPLYVVLMCAAAGLLGGLWALIPGVLRAFANTNEIITSLMLNYVAGYLLTYLIFDSSSYWRDTSSLQARSFPQGKPMPDASNWYAFGSSVVVPLGFLIGLAAATVIWILYSRTRFGFEVSVIADSPRAARYAGMRTRRKILAVMALSGAVAGLGGASQIGEFAHTLDGSPSGLQAAAFGYTGIVVAALARYNPFAVCVVAVLIGGLLNAGSFLQGPDFPSGLVGVMQGIILFCALGGELFIRYRLRFTRHARGEAATPEPAG